MIKFYYITKYKVISVIASQESFKFLFFSYNDCIHLCLLTVKFVKKNKKTQNPKTDFHFQVCKSMIYHLNC